MQSLLFGPLERDDGGRSDRSESLRHEPVAAVETPQAPGLVVGHHVVGPCADRDQECEGMIGNGVDVADRSPRLP